MIADGLKELFFRNLFGSIQDRMVLGRLLDFQIILTSKHFDNYDVFVHGKFHWLFTHLIYAVGGSIARLFGMWITLPLQLSLIRLNLAGQVFEHTIQSIPPADWHRWWKSTANRPRNYNCAYDGRQMHSLGGGVHRSHRSMYSV